GLGSGEGSGGGGDVSTTLGGSGEGAAAGDRASEMTPVKPITVMTVATAADTSSSLNPQPRSRIRGASVHRIPDERMKDPPTLCKDPPALRGSSRSPRARPGSFPGPPPGGA